MQMRPQHRMSFVALVLVVALAASMSLAACGGEDTPTTPPANGTDAGPGADDATTGDAAPSDAARLVEVKCSMCHSLDRVYATDQDRDGWSQIIDRMKRNGLVITDEEYNAIIDFLAEE